MDEQNYDFSRFRQFTRKQKTPLPAQAATSFGQTLQFRLFNTGLINKILLYFSGTITSGSGAPTGSWGTYLPLPYALIKRIRVYTSENVTVWDTSGWGCAYRNLYLKQTYAMATDPSQYLSTNNRTALYQTNTGTPAASTAYTFSGWLEVPIGTDDMMMLGLLLMQNLDVQLFMDIQFATQTDLGTIAGVTYTPNITFYPNVEFFTIPPAESMALPNLKYVHVTQETLYPFTSNGEVIVRPPIGNVYLSASGIMENNGAQIAPTNIGNLQIAYAQTVLPYNETYQQHIAGIKSSYNFTPPDGSFMYDWYNGIGVPAIYEPRDFMNTAQQTDFQMKFNFTGLTPSSAQIRLITEQLAAVM